MSKNLEALRANPAATAPAKDQAAKRPAAAKRRAVRRRSFDDLAIGAALPAIVLAVWQLAGSAGWIDPFFLPTPVAILDAFKELALHGRLGHHFGVSVWRALAGFLLGGGLGFAVGLLAGFYRRAEHLVDPSIQLLRMVPHLALAPLVILWFGFGETSKIVIIATGAFFPMYLNTLAGIRGADNRLFEVARVLGFGPRTTVLRLVLPAALPGILLGVRLSLALSWLGLVVAELLGSTSGIGFLINTAKQNSTTDEIFVGIAIFAAVGKAADSLVRLLERKRLHWRDGYQG
ncbi:sulfonate transport system permease protein [Paenibacillus sp. UNC496MF]|uniref:ABC transporter permease n=1 Tax=Paenibacillus sp. UNC496MF TaxID=1502753 RepID=UPI0008E3D358|nr:ABC transporter permease [Paenibacillus sp. UNC496MF]SFI87210.1 sulfonate transport system permease protein [Paenibacillus sp. UNC496MF]